MRHADRSRTAICLALAASFLMTEAGLTMRMARAEDNVPAKQLFGAQTTPAPLKPASIGSYARGCLAGAQPIAIDGPNWQVMRLSRNRNWGHPALISYLEKLATDAGQSGMWNGLLVGDMAQPRGGPMLTGHNSHQIGLDADIWLTEMPNRRLTRDEREKTSAVSMVNFDTKQVNRNVWTSRQAALIQRAASYREVARIFVNPIIKKELCRVAGDDRDWLRKVRPWAGHHFHMHIRLACPSGTSGCKNQPAPERDDGCGEDLARWFLPPTKPDKPARPTPPLTLANLPDACAMVLDVARADGAASPKPTR